MKLVTEALKQESNFFWLNKVGDGVKKLIDVAT